MTSPSQRPLRLALVPWMVAGVRTQYENLRLLGEADGFHAAYFPIVPYREGGLIERLPLLRSSHKGTLRSMLQALQLLHHGDHDVVWSQVLLPLLPLICAIDTGLVHRPALVYAIDTTPRLMDDFSELYYARPPAGDPKRVLRDALFRYILRHCDLVMPWSEWAARSFRRDYGVPARRIRVQPPGVDLQSWSVPPDRSTRAAAGGEPFRLLFVGADFARKGGPLLVDVFNSCLRGSCELHLVTKAQIGPDDRVHVYAGFSPNEPGLRSLYQRCDALVLPTRADCFSLAALEAMATGLPVITCPVGGIPEIVRERETGLLIPVDDGPALLQAIETLRGDRHLAVAMGLAGRKLVEERFNGATIGAALYGLLKQLGGRRAIALARRVAS